MAQDQSKMQQFAELEQLIRKAAKEEAEKVYDEKGAQFSVPQVPYHEHNGVDSIQLSEDNILLTTKLQTQLIALNTDVVPSTEVFTVKNVNNVSRISFHGYGANNASGAPATQRAVLTGEIIFGRCYNFTGTGSTIVVTTGTPGAPFKHACNFMFIDTASINNTKVGTAPYLAYAVDGTGTQIIAFYLTGYSNNSLTFTVTLAAGFKIEGNIIIE